MIFRGLDSDGDWSFGHGKADYLDSNDAIALNIKTRIYSWLNDCFFDLSAGIDWMNRLGNKNQKLLLDSDLQRIIIESYGVTGITSFSSELIGRNYSASYEIQTIYSQSYIDTITREL
jgi:hypothetical protein